jgi:membrane protein implicated in regulation of membrane protease activity
MNWTALWLIAALVAGIVEILVPLFGFVFVSVAAVVAALGSATGLSVATQVVLFAVTLAVSLALLRPLAKKMGARGVPTRTEALVGRRAQVVAPIDPVLGTGRVNVGGDDWAARSATALPAGAEVVVEGADGIVLLVAPSRPASTV